MTQSNTGPLPTSGWDVVSQGEESRVDDAGNVQRGLVVTFRTGNGVTGTVFVPALQITPERVRSAIMAEAGIRDAIGSLSHPAEG